MSAVDTTGKPRALRVAICALHLLAGALLSVSAGAQDDDPDYSRLIFEVAEIPPAVIEQDTTAAATSSSTDDTGPANFALENNSNLTADIAAYRARISDTLATDNPYSAALREQYDALGTLLQQAEEHEDAIVAFESAMHIDRVNGGLYTLDQIPVVEKMLASHEALGNAEEVNDLHAYLFYIQQKTYADDDPRLLAAMEAWADWNVASYLTEGARYDSLPAFSTGASLSSNRLDYVAVQNRDGSFSYIPRSQLIGVMNPLGNSALFDPAFTAAHGVNAERVIDERLRTARDYYEDIIEKTAPAETPADDEAAAASSEAAPDNASPGTDEDIRVQHKLANVAYAVKQQIESMDTVMDQGSLYYNRIMQPRTTPQVVTRGYIDNREALEAIAQQLEQDPDATVLEKAQAWISLGDWHVGFDHGARSDDAYRKAWDLLAGAGMDAAAIDEVFMPHPLIPAPAFAVHQYSRELYGIAANEELAYKGHMDLTLNVNRYGDVNGVKIDAVSPGTPQVLRTELLNYLRGAKVRPAVVNGEIVKREDVKLRYYYTY